MTQSGIAPHSAVRRHAARVAAVLASAFAIPLLSGCGDAIHNFADDDRYIRSPDEPIPSPIALADKSLSPIMTPGLRHRVRIAVQTIANRAVPADGSASNDTSQVVVADVVCAGPRALPSGGTGAVFETRLPGRVKPVRSEVYSADNSGVYLSGIPAAPDGTLMLSTPMALIHYPVREGDVRSWTGTVSGRAGTIPATGYSRVSDREALTLPNSSHPVDSYRIDTVIELQLPTRGVSMLTSRWFAPGHGMVRERFADGMNRVTVEQIDGAAG
jgi:hypothetical protein